MTSKRVLTTALIAVIGLLIGVSAVNWTGIAHDNATVGPYKITFGGSDEPVITGERMWMELRVVNVETEEPVEGLAETLTLAVEFGDREKDLPLSAVHGQPGRYKSALIFQEPGDYEFHIGGDINGTEVHTHFDKEVLDRESLYF